MVGAPSSGPGGAPVVEALGVTDMVDIDSWTCKDKKHYDFLDCYNDKACEILIIKDTKSLNRGGVDTVEKGLNTYQKIPDPELRTVTDR
jgi:hypothetical protein